jgi:acetate kinase
VAPAHRTPTFPGDKPVLVVNTGSSSCKLAVVHGDRSVATATLDPWDGSPEPMGEALESLLDGHEVAAVAHRVVHGGARFAGAVLVDDGVLAEIEALTPLAPLHQPRAVLGMRAAAEALPDLPAVACFDTAFHRTIPPAASTYAIPAEWREEHGIHRYGFHGLSHAGAARQAASLLRRPLEDLRIVTAHLGGGASLCAVQAGRSVDTTMGFTPLEGLVMTTRSGSIDPGIVLWLQQRAGLCAEEIEGALQHRSGLAGLSGMASGDLREVGPAAVAGSVAALLALDVYVHRLRGHVAAMAAAMAGLDALVFTGGAGEHQPAIRKRTVAGLGFLGLGIDEAANERAAGDADISARGARTSTLVVTTREDAEIARQVESVLGRGMMGQ